MRPEDGGQYSCVVTNMAGSSSLFFTVEIVCKSYLDMLLFPRYSFLSVLSVCKKVCALIIFPVNIF